MNRRQAVDVLAVDRGVEGERQAELAHPAGDLQLLGVAARVVGDAVGVGGVRVLDRDLHMVEAALRPAPPGARASASTAGGDEVGVEPDLGAPARRSPPGRGARSARRRRDAAAARRARPPAPARRARPRSAARRPRAPAPAGWSSRGIAAGSDASARPAARPARGMRAPLRLASYGLAALTPSPRPCRRGPAAWRRRRPGCCSLGAL